MKLTLVFPTLVELNGYLDALKHDGVITDYKNLSLTGTFDQKDVELAENQFHAIIIKAK